MAWTAHIDGGSRGNPGPAAAGVCLADEKGKVVFAGGFFLGTLTNNQAEYRGLLAALDLLHAAGAKRVNIVSDSELMVQQLLGHYRVKSPDLKPLFAEAKEMLGRFDSWEVRHVLREGNTHADRMVNRALDAVRDVVEVDARGLAGRHVEAAPAAKPAAHAPGGIELLVIKPPASGSCAAGLRKGQSFQFSDVTPAGLCLHACAVAIEGVRAMEEFGTADEPTAPMTVSCDHPGCGAVFELRSHRR